eukprot:TRINITY_DN3145_c0_g1_i1.p1 TRINITY_DN3145_c0_g1~~TRINITY_DN3145_c0_g1_i1.p1  ORF type:complete len:418 (+),score=92.57 TRINITY_DN3145_c0_g1_i1:215-1468(+)
MAIGFREQLVVALMICAGTAGALATIELALTSLLLWFLFTKILVQHFGLRTNDQLARFFGPTGLFLAIAICSKLLLTEEIPTTATGTGYLKAVYDPALVGGVNVIRETPSDRQNPNMGLMIVKISAAALNPVDFKVKQIKAAIPFVRWVVDRGIASDFAGVVVNTGRDCRFSKGDEIFGYSNVPVLQGFSTMSCDSAVAIRPAALSVEQAAGCGVTCITTYDALVTRRALQEGQRLLVVGASGGCGSLAVSLGKILGAHVTGIASSRNADTLKALGVDEFVDYTGESFASWEPAHKFDVIYDTVSSPDSNDPDYEPRARPWLAQGLTYTAINTARASDWPRAILSRVTGMDLQREDYDLFLPTPTPAKFEAIAGFAGQGYVPLIDTVYPTLDAESLRKGVERQLGRRAKGKIVFKLV